MHPSGPLGQPPPRAQRRDGFTLLELLLVTVVLGVLASISAPYFSAARERAIETQMRADMRNVMQGVESYILLNGGQFPTSLEELVDGSTYVQTPEVEACMFLAIPPSPLREGYVIAMTAHPGTSTNMVIVYPLWGSEILDFDSGAPGC